MLQCFKCQQHWSGRDAVIDPEKAIEHDESDNIAHESVDSSDLFDGVKEDVKQKVMQMLGTHPEWEEGIRKFKETEPEKFKGFNPL